MAVRQGSILQFGEPRRGCRAYLAVAGGFDVPGSWAAAAPICEPSSAVFGACLKAGDILNLSQASEPVSRRVWRWLDAAGSQDRCGTWTAALDRV